MALPDVISCGVCGCNHFKGACNGKRLAPAATIDVRAMQALHKQTPYIDIGAAKSKATTTNPKDLMGDKKVSLDAISPFANLEESKAMMDGEWKYGFRNWREKDVRARVYGNAAKRHLELWLEGQEYAGDSKVHHLGHARACLGILLDAQATGNLIDDRAKTGDLLEHHMVKASAWVAWRKAYNRYVQLDKEIKEEDHKDLPDYEYVWERQEELKLAVSERDRLEAEYEALEV